jgi:undecaprenyl diphosphate synthase
MDGNGRWAEKRRLPRLMGHRAGADALDRTMHWCKEAGIGYLTVYAFSTENWKRPKKEVDAIMKLLEEYLDKQRPENATIRFIGDVSMLSEKLAKKIRLMEEETAGHESVLNVALNYGGRDEILRSVKALTAECIGQGRDPQELTEDDISRFLYSGSAHFNVPDPDLIIRTSGEERMSNFLTWQGAYSELMFTDTLWPDFTPEEYTDMVEAYANRDRRFGGRKENDK